LDEHYGKLEFVGQYQAALAKIDFDSVFGAFREEQGPGRNAGLIPVAHQLMRTNPENALRALKESPLSLGDSWNSCVFQEKNLLNLRRDI